MHRAELSVPLHLDTNVSAPPMNQFPQKLQHWGLHLAAAGRGGGGGKGGRGGKNWPLLSLFFKGWSSFCLPAKWALQCTHPPPPQLCPRLAKVHYVLMGWRNLQLPCFGLNGPLHTDPSGILVEDGALLLLRWTQISKIENGTKDVAKLAPRN